MAKTWTIIGGVEVGVYASLLLISLYPSYRLIFQLGKGLWSFFVRYYLFLLLRIAAGVVLCVYSQNPNNNNMLVAVIVMSSISLGFISMLLIFCLRYIEIYHNPNYVPDNKNMAQDFMRPLVLVAKFLDKDYTRSVAYQEVAERILWVAIILGAITGGVSTSTQIALTKALSVLYAVSLIIIFVSLIMTFRDRTYSNRIRNHLLTIACIVFPFVTIRVIEGLIASFQTKDSYGLNKFTIYEGKWELYTFVVFLQEFLSAATYTAVPYVILNAELKRVRERSWGVEVDSSEDKAYDNNYGTRA